MVMICYVLVILSAAASLLPPYNTRGLIYSSILVFNAFAFYGLSFVKW